MNGGIKMIIEICDGTLMDKEFILKGHKEILKVSGLTKSELEKNIEADFDSKVCRCLIAKSEGVVIAMCIYSDVYWADSGGGIYLSQIYVEPEYRGKGAVKQFLKHIMEETKCNFITCLVGPENKCMQNVMDNLGADKENLIPYTLHRISLTKEI